jgi:hypothetical protein
MIRLMIWFLDAALWAAQRTPHCRETKRRIRAALKSAAHLEVTRG